MIKTLDEAPSSTDQLRKSYEPAFFQSLAAIEDQHFWFRARNQTIASLVRQIEADFPLGYRVLEIGCGTGNVLRVLEQECPNGLVIGADLFIEGLSFASERVSCSLLQTDVHALPFASKFNLICMFDVLEHLPDDEDLLAYLHGALAPGGILFLTVPAHPYLWSYFDEAAHHCRRYRPSELNEKLIKAGFRIEYQTQYMASIFPPVWFGRKLATLINIMRLKKKGQIDSMTLQELNIKPAINTLLTWMLSLEIRLIEDRHKLPFGTSLLALAQK
jgi:SAM-dependent methyltransferase